jgi:uncharacterized repeat protein (TIGR01451 family)
MLSASAATAAVGDMIAYRVEVRLANPSQTSGVSRAVVTDTLPAGVELVSAAANRGPGCIGTSTVTCDLDFLSGSLVGVVELTVRVTTAGALVDTASVAAPETDPEPGNNTASVTVVVAAPPPPRAPAGAPRLRRARRVTGLLRASRFGRVASVMTRVGVDRDATVTLSARALRDGKRLSLWTGTRMAATMVAKPTRTARAVLDRAGTFPIKVRVPAYQLERGAAYQLVLTATSNSGKAGTLKVNFLG